MSRQSPSSKCIQQQSPTGSNPAKMVATCPRAKNQPYGRRRTSGIWPMCVRVYHLGSTRSCPLGRWPSTIEPQHIVVRLLNDFLSTLKK
uniref:Uncharacterized protein n=1 Tax=Lepeophtheirus salmonis TaxID=72036 RepID=A0A0K2U022_LEPSM